MSFLVFAILPKIKQAASCREKVKGGDGSSQDKIRISPTCRLETVFVNQMFWVDRVGGVQGHDQSCRALIADVK